MRKHVHVGTLSKVCDEVAIRRFRVDNAMDLLRIRKVSIDDSKCITYTCFTTEKPVDIADPPFDAKKTLLVELIQSKKDVSDCKPYHKVSQCDYQTFVAQLSPFTTQDM